MALIKFSSKIDPQVLDRLRVFARQSDRPLSHVLNEAVAQYLQRSELRPAFRKALGVVLVEHESLLERLSR